MRPVSTIIVSVALAITVPSKQQFSAQGHFSAVTPRQWPEKCLEASLYCLCVRWVAIRVCVAMAAR
eukprot:3043382-Amphidinium_carterae.1